MPAIDSQAIAHGAQAVAHGAQVAAREATLLMHREMHEMSTIMKRNVDHSALETLAVVLTCIFGIGGWMYYLMKYK
ncbi:hypothetical protein F4780DRAFT_776736 [Xylariomycetidae sp. FL0641]|nr:hypothetical protein F4780DRAFT_776736 [Xylariomycetidae sp. FL0641]